MGRDILQHRICDHLNIKVRPFCEREPVFSTADELHLLFGLNRNLIHEELKMVY
jgi:hypothetical protein